MKKVERPPIKELLKYINKWKEVGILPKKED